MKVICQVQINEDFEASGFGESLLNMGNRFLRYKYIRIDGSVVPTKADEWCSSFGAMTSGDAIVELECS